MNIKAIVLAALAVTSTVLTIYMTQDNGTKSPLQSESMRAFMSYNSRFGKEHSSKEEHSYRFKVYLSNLKFVQEHQKKNLSYEVGENEFFDLTFEEFSQKYLSQQVRRNFVFSHSSPKLITGDKKKDWREDNIVTEVKNQLRCGSCWAFSAIGSLESAYALANKSLVEFSEKELVDCSSSYGNNGCNGGIMALGLDYIKDHGVGLESDYPYQPSQDKCTADTSKTRVTIKSHKGINPVDVYGLLNSIDVTPVSVGIEVQKSFQLYTSGIYVSDDSSCGEHLNHGVLAVGYKVSDSENYFIVKNSWGPAWGESGYIRMAIGTGSGTCGIANRDAVYPIL
jgi:C1A family cysteine protease